MTDQAQVDEPKPSGHNEIGLTAIREYIWARYVDNEWDRDIEYDEEQILAQLGRHYDEHPPETDPEAWYYAVLLFERSFHVKAADHQREMLLEAKRIFDAYIRLTGERDWDVVTDRLEDIRAHFDSEGLSLEGIEQSRRQEEQEEEDEQIRVLRQAAPEGMLLVPAGIFQIGEDKQQISMDGFYVDATPVTNGQYQKFLEETGYRAPKYWESEGFERPKQPVVGVSYFDAMKYAQWAGKVLPSSQQWEAAARGTDGRSFPWGEGLDVSKASYDHSGPEAGLLDVGSFPDNISPCGCVDMAGLVWEWTDTWFDDEHESKIIKGGSWADPADMLACEFAFYAPPKEKLDIVGFRCVKPVN
jgi:formylglycine-generating enzyme